MKLFIFTFLLAVLASLCAAKASLKTVVVSYAPETPSEIISQAKNAITDAGGQVTHEFKLINAFAANAPASVLESVQAWGSQYKAVIEEDGMVQTQG